MLNKTFNLQNLASGRSIGLLAALVALIAVFAATNRYFFTLETALVILADMPSLVVIAIGMTYVLIIGEIDLSVGSVLALSGAVIAVAIGEGGVPIALSVPLGLATGLGCGVITGALTVGWRLPSFIVSLGMLEIARGGAYIITDSRTQYLGYHLSFLSTPIIGPVSSAIVMMVVLVVLAQLILDHSVFGRKMIGIGTNETAMRLAGIDPGPIKLWVFALLGLLSGLAGLMQLSRLEAADPNAGLGVELQAIAAVVIGGTSLSGGRGSVVNSFIGVIIIAVLEAGLAQSGASEPLKRIATGSVILLAVLLDQSGRVKRP
jgi:ribose transport system permease protein